VFDVGFSVVPGVVDDPVPMIRRSVDRIELQWNAARVNNVVIRSSWDNYRETGHYRRPNTIEYRVAITCFYAKELVELVYLRPDFFPQASTPSRRVGSVLPYTARGETLHFRAPGPQYFAGNPS
jgi:hypothetical protein